MAVLVLAMGGLVLHTATANDQADGITADALDKYLPPAGAKLDVFDDEGALGPTDTFAWSVPDGSWLRQQVAVRASGADANVAVVDPGQIPVLIDARVGSARPGGGLLISERQGDRLELVVDKDGTGWELVRTQGGNRALVQLLRGPTSDVVIQVVRRATSVTITFDREGDKIDLPGTPLVGTGLGMIAQGPGTTFDRFAYLPLDG